MALAFVRMAGEIRRMSEVAFFSRFGETGRIVPFIPEPPDVAAGRIFDLHQRHAAAVCEVFDAAINSHASDLREQTLPVNCLLRLGWVAAIRLCPRRCRSGNRNRTRQTHRGSASLSTSRREA